MGFNENNLMKVDVDKLRSIIREKRNEYYNDLSLDFFVGVIMEETKGLFSVKDIRKLVLENQN